MSRILFWDSFDITGPQTYTKSISAAPPAWTAANPKAITKQQSAAPAQFVATDVKQTTKIFNAT